MGIFKSSRHNRDNSHALVWSWDLVAFYIKHVGENMDLFKTQIDHSNCLKRPDHWIGTFLFIALAALGLYYVKQKEIQSQKNVEE